MLRLSKLERTVVILDLRLSAAMGRCSDSGEPSLRHYRYTEADGIDRQLEALSIGVSISTTLRRASNSSRCSSCHRGADSTGNELDLSRGGSANGSTALLKELQSAGRRLSSLEVWDDAGEAIEGTTEMCIRELHFGYCHVSPPTNLRLSSFSR